jgi:pantothenate kinase type III
MMRNGLVSNTGISNDQWVDEVPEVSWLGNDTRSGVVAGAVCATVGAVNQVVRRSRQELGVELQCIVTGGDAEVLVRHWDVNVRLEPDWVLKGLAIVAQGEL